MVKDAIQPEAVVGSPALLIARLLVVDLVLGWMWARTWRGLSFVGGGLIDKIYNTGAEDLAINQLERLLIDSIGEKALATSDHNWVDHEV